jgi:hypothetical protein
MKYIYVGNNNTIFTGIQYWCTIIFFFFNTQSTTDKNLFFFFWLRQNRSLATVCTMKIEQFVKMEFTSNI